MWRSCSTIGHTDRVFGDDFYPAPYAYVCAHDHDEDQFWNVPFGALRDAGEFGSSEDLVAFGARVERCYAGDSQRPSRSPRATVRIRIVW